MKTLIFLFCMICLCSCDDQPPVERQTGNLDELTRVEKRDGNGERVIERYITVDGSKWEIDGWEYLDNLNATGTEVIVTKDADGNVDVQDADLDNPVEDIPDPRENEPID